MTFNERIIREDNPGGEIYGEPYLYSIHEVYYENDGTIIGWRERPVNPMVTDADINDKTPTIALAMRNYLTRMLKATEKPILKIVDNKLVEIE